MVNSRISILIPSCDKYSSLWFPFFQCFSKYWPDCPFPIYLGVNNDKDFFYPGVIKIKTGLDRGYSNNLLHYIDNIKGEIILFWIEDRFLSKKVKTKEVIDAVNFFERKNLDFLKIINGHPYSYSREPKNKYLQLGELEKYWVCLTVALWNKSVLRDILVNVGGTAWNLERKGSCYVKSKNYNFYSLSYLNRTNPIFHEKHILIKGKINRKNIDFLNNELLMTELEVSQKQSFFSFIYIFIYQLFFDLLGKFKQIFSQIDH